MQVGGRQGCEPAWRLVSREWAAVGKALGQGPGAQGSVSPLSKVVLPSWPQRVDTRVAVGHGSAGGGCISGLTQLSWAGQGWVREKRCFVSHGLCDTVASEFKKMPCGPNVVLGMGDFRFP